MTDGNVTRVLLIRHGETEGNNSKIIQGHGNTPLTKLGREQSWAAGRLVASLRPVALYCSDLGRAKETSAIIGRKAGLDPVAEPLLREQDLGEWEGRPWEEIERDYPEEMQKRVTDGWDYTPPGGERRLDQVKRLDEFCRLMRERHPGGTVAAVSHGGTIGLYFRFIWRVPFGDHRFPVKIDNCALSRVEVHEGAIKLVSFNEVSHLNGLK